jgi:hypothetical protein
MQGLFSNPDNEKLSGLQGPCGDPAKTVKTENAFRPCSYFTKN